jgi:anti-sigma28 factor (negative regulator of flagellin synthesis)
MPKLRPQVLRQIKPIGEGKRSMMINQIQEQIGRGEYQVDTRAVAEAFLRCLGQESKLVPAEDETPQAECS